MKAVQARKARERGKESEKERKKAFICGASKQPSVFLI